MVTKDAEGPAAAPAEEPTTSGVSVGLGWVGEDRAIVLAIHARGGITSSFMDPADARVLAKQLLILLSEEK